MPTFNARSPAGTSVDPIPRPARVFGRPQIDLTSWVLVCALAAGSILRLVGLRWGLPLRLHSDEWVIVNGAIDMAQRNSFEPGYFFRPDHLEMQLSLIAYQAYSHLLHGTSPEALFAVDQSPFYLISRTITALFGIGMIVIAYLIGRRFSRQIGLLSAVFVALFPPFVENSHYATPDVPLSFACMVVILGSMRYLESRGWRDLFLACLGVALAVVVKYPGAVCALMIAVVVIVAGVRDRAWLRLVTHGVGAVLLSVALTFAISPVLFTNISAVLEQVTAQNSTGHLGADGLGWAGNMAFYAHDLVAGTGLLLAVCFVLGVCWCVRRRLLQALPLLVGVVMWVVVSRLELHWDRWGLPMYLTPLLVAPIGIWYTYEYLQKRARGTRWSTIGLALVVGVTVLNLLVGSLAVTARFLAVDTRSASLEFTSERGLSLENTIVEGYTPLTPGVARVFFGDFRVVDGELQTNPETVESGTIEYVLSSSDMSDRFKAESKYADQQTVYRLLDEQFPVVQEWEATGRAEPSMFEVVQIVRSLGYVRELAGGGMVGPTITLYEVPEDRR